MNILMSTIVDVLVKQAFDLGYAAAVKGVARAPAINADFVKLIPITEKAGGHKSVIALMHAYQRGYQAQCDECAAAVLEQF